MAYQNLWGNVPCYSSSNNAKYLKIYGGKSSLREIATLAIIREISDSNLETRRYSPKFGVSLSIRESWQHCCCDKTWVQIYPFFKKRNINQTFKLFWPAGDRLACEPQTYFRSLLLWGREAMTGNTSVICRLEIDEYNNVMVDLPVTHPL